MMKVRLRGDVLDGLLTRNNIPREDFAKKIDISMSYLAQLIKNDKFPSPRLRSRIQSELVGRSFDDLFEIVETPNVD